MRPTEFVRQGVDLIQKRGSRDVADTYDEDVQVTVDAAVSLLEPMIIVVMGVFVGLLVLSILMPILNLTSGIG